MSEENKVEANPDVFANGKWKVAEYVGGVSVPLYEGPAEIAGEKYDERCKNLVAGTVTLTDPDGKIREQKVRAAFRPHVGDEGKIEYADVDEPFRPEPIQLGQGGIVKNHVGAKRSSSADDVAREPAPVSEVPASAAFANMPLVTIEQLDVAISRLLVVIEVLKSRRRMFCAQAAAHNDIASVQAVLNWALQAMPAVAP